MTTYKPLNTVIVIELDEAEEVSAGGIVFAKETADKSKRDQVVVTIKAIGPYAWADMPESRCEVGDRVVIRRYAWTELEMGGDKELVLVNDVSILAKVID
jgi:co-chaperonin GroES (HSP10)